MFNNIGRIFGLLRFVVLLGILANVAVAADPLAERKIGVDASFDAADDDARTFTYTGLDFSYDRTSYANSTAGSITVTDSSGNPTTKNLAAGELYFPVNTIAVVNFTAGRIDSVISTNHITNEHYAIAKVFVDTTKPIEQNNKLIFSKTFISNLVYKMQFETELSDQEIKELFLNEIQSINQTLLNQGDSEFKTEFLKLETELKETYQTKSMTDKRIIEYLSIFAFIYSATETGTKKEISKDVKKVDLFLVQAIKRNFSNRQLAPSIVDQYFHNLYELAVYYYRGGEWGENPDEKDLKKALKILTFMSQNSILIAQSLLLDVIIDAELVLNEDLKTLVLSLAEEGFENAHLILARGYFYGEKGFHQDIDKSLQFLKQLLEKEESMTARFLLLEMYESNETNLDRDDPIFDDFKE